MRILVVGANGMIGSTIIRVLSEKPEFDVFGSIRDTKSKDLFSKAIAEKLVPGIEVTLESALLRLFKEIQPEVVINCAGLTKHLHGANDPNTAIPINALFPHRLAAFCQISGARLIHVSTDCVFSGTKGGYVEADQPDAIDFYGQTKAMGEVDNPNAITLRTSTIGHELNTAYGLLDWFLSQDKQCKGFSKAVFSGLPTVIFAEIIRDIVIPRSEMHGLYQVAARPINKYDLLKLIAHVYKKDIEIIADDSFVIDRSLDASKFNQVTGYNPPSWQELIETMHQYQ
ncbi:MAG TPA: SDR family oxidoreductase [Methylotenera sp.]|nr:SDR family oxidoreductase [Methylotenera sp.]